MHGLTTRTTDRTRPVPAAVGWGRSLNKACSAGYRELSRCDLVGMPAAPGMGWKHGTGCRVAGAT